MRKQQEFRIDSERNNAKNEHERHEVILSGGGAVSRGYRQTGRPGRYFLSRTRWVAQLSGQVEVATSAI